MGHSNGKNNGIKEVLLYGKHPIEMALKNKRRKILELYGTREALSELKLQNNLQAKCVDRTYLENLVGRDSLHQGLVAKCLPLPQPDIASFLKNIDQQSHCVIMILDQVTDPHNIGAILRSAVAFDASAVIIPEAGAPDETGTLAKSASGALELIPFIRVSNLARLIEKLKEHDFWCIGLDGYASQSITQTKLPGKCAFIMGSEGSGMRRLTQEKCDYCVKLPMNPDIESLNVSNAAALTLYEFRHQFPNR